MQDQDAQSVIFEKYLLLVQETLDELKVDQTLVQNVETLINIWTVSGKLASRGLVLRSLINKQCAEILETIPNRFPVLDDLFSNLPPTTEIDFLAYLQFYALYWFDQNIDLAMRKARQIPNTGWSTILSDVPVFVQQELPLLIYRILQIQNAPSIKYRGLNMIIQALPGSLVQITKPALEPGASKKHKAIHSWGMTLTYEYKLDPEQADPILQQVAEMIKKDHNMQVFKNLPYKDANIEQLASLIAQHLRP